MMHESRSTVDGAADHKDVVVKSCEKLHVKIKQQQAADDKTFIAAHEQCLANVQSLQTVHSRFQKAEAEARAGIHRTTEEIETKVQCSQLRCCTDHDAQVVEIGKSHARIGLLEKQVAKLDSDWRKNTTAFSEREEKRNGFVDRIKSEVSKLCLLSDYKSSRCAITPSPLA